MHKQFSNHPIKIICQHQYKSPDLLHWLAHTEIDSNHNLPQKSDPTIVCSIQINPFVVFSTPHLVLHDFRHNEDEERVFLGIFSKIFKMLLIFHSGSCNPRPILVSEFAFGKVGVCVLCLCNASKSFFKLCPYENSFQVVYLLFLNSIYFKIKTISHGVVFIWFWMQLRVILFVFQYKFIGVFWKEVSYVLHYWCLESGNWYKTEENHK